MRGFIVRGRVAKTAYGGAISSKSWRIAGSPLVSRTSGS